MIILLPILIYVIFSIISYSLLDNVHYNEFGSGNFFMVIPAIFGPISLIASLIVILIYKLNSKSTKIWSDRLSDDSDIPKREFREIRMIRVLHPKKYKLYQLKFILFPSSLDKFIKKI